MKHKVRALAVAAAIGLVAVACTPGTEGEPATTRASEPRPSAQESPTVAPPMQSGQG
jgi:hypothetical protein